MYFYGIGFLFCLILNKLRGIKIRFFIEIEKVGYWVFLFVVFWVWVLEEKCIIILKVIEICEKSNFLFERRVVFWKEILFDCEFRFVNL